MVVVGMRPPVLDVSGVSPDCVALTRPRAARSPEGV